MRGRSLWGALQYETREGKSNGSVWCSKDIKDRQCRPSKLSINLLSTSIKLIVALDGGKNESRIIRQYS